MFPSLPLSQPFPPNWKQWFSSAFQEAMILGIIFCGWQPLHVQASSFGSINKVLTALWQQAVLWPLWCRQRMRNYYCHWLFCCFVDEFVASFVKSDVQWVPASHSISRRGWKCMSILELEGTCERCINKLQGACGLLLCMITYCVSHLQGLDQQYENPYQFWVFCGKANAARTWKKSEDGGWYKYQSTLPILWLK